VRLIGREHEWRRLEEAADRAREGGGGLVLLAGEAGIGKTRLSEDVAADAGGPVLRGAAAHGATPPYGPLAGALRPHLRDRPEGIAACGPLQTQLALVLPELGEPPPAPDPGALVEAVRCALRATVDGAPLVVLLDDLHRSDEATLDVLAGLARPLRTLPVLVVAAYRSDEIPRGHPLRRLRDDLRRQGALDEVALDRLSAAETAALAERVLGEALSPPLARAVHDRTQGVPFFVEELCAALRESDRLQPSRRGLELAGDDEVPVPETVRDAVLLRTASLSEAARAGADVAAVAGPRFDAGTVAGLAGEGALEELLAGGLVVETDPGTAAFRHALVRDALYADVPWLRRRALHRELAVALEARDASAAEVAAHWLAAREDERARPDLLRAVAELRARHAYRDAARAARQALDLWPEGEEPALRAAALEDYAACAELAGDFAEAGRAWREVTAARRAQDDDAALGAAERRLAAVYELQGDRRRALESRRAAAEAFAAGVMPAEAAADRLAGAGHLQSAGRHGEAIELARAAEAEARAAERPDLVARSLGLAGVATAKRGDFDDGLATVRSGLSLALEHELAAEAAEVYQRLGTALESAADYAGARDALDTAIGLCERSGEGSQEQGCVACMAYVLRELGDWDRAMELAGELVEAEAGPGTLVIADGVLGAIEGFRGNARRARPLLERSLNTALRLGVISMLVDAAGALAWVDELEGADEAADEHCRLLLERWSATEDRHYAVWGLRYAACRFAVRGAAPDARACADALARIAGDTGHPDALAALAHALAEIALLDGDADTATVQLDRALELHQQLEIPFERAQLQLRSGVALAAAGAREPALERLGEAYRTARRLGARPLAAEAAAQVDLLGASIELQLGRRAAAEHDGAGLSRRELEVMRLVATGRTNREIAERLYLSTRTVDMHVRNILVKLGCRSRVEAVSRAGDLGILG